jgi:hypothetical protein
MFLCYIDESGTINSDNTSHYVLAGLSIPIEKWKLCEKSVGHIKARYDLSNSEIHTGWMLRQYLEQSRIPKFDELDYQTRRVEVRRFRHQELLRLNKPATQKQYHRTKKNYKETDSYVHLTLKEREQLIFELAEMIGKWGFCRLFSECIDKIHFDPSLSPLPMDEQAFEQLISRFQHFLGIMSKTKTQREFGLLIHDNNPTVSKRHTDLMKRFHNVGTFWTSVENIVETPFYVDSQLTSMVQLADLCSYAIRRYCEKSETRLFNEIFKRADTKGNKTVGVRHFSSKTCSCLICGTHK